MFIRRVLVIGQRMLVSEVAYDSSILKIVLFADCATSGTLMRVSQSKSWRARVCVVLMDHSL